MIDENREDIRRILGLAEDLGKSIADSERYHALQEISQEIEQDEETSGLVKNYSRLTLKGSSEASEADKRLQELLEKRIRENPKIMQLLKTQADFAELMSKVRSTLADSIGSQIETGI